MAERFSWCRAALLVLMGLCVVVGWVWVALGPMDLGYVRREREHERRDEEWVRRQVEKDQAPAKREGSD